MKNFQIILFLILCTKLFAFPDNYVAGSLFQLNDNGAWSWFMDERLIVHDDQLVVGSVRAVGEAKANVSHPDWGNVEISVYDLVTGETGSVVFHPHFEQDDHDTPAFLVLPDDRILAVYSKHSHEQQIYYRFSNPENPLEWTPAAVFETPGEPSNWGGDNVTYNNLFRMPDGSIYNFHRGFSQDPNYIISKDDGQTWTYGGRLMFGKDGYSPYLKYAQASDGTIHIIATEDHPRNYDNSVYHGIFKNGALYHSNGDMIGEVSGDTTASIATWDLTRVFKGDPDNVGWVVDLELDENDHPYLAFSVQKDGRGLPPTQGGMDLRYHYARWDGEKWLEYEMAHAGTRLYSFEDDYSGLVALDPNDPDIVYISTDADPVTGEPLISTADGQRHYELYRGETADGGKTWQWTPLTQNSMVDNLRPLVPRWQDERTLLVWMRGTYTHNAGEWTTAVVGMVLP